MRSNSVHLFAGLALCLGVACVMHPSLGPAGRAQAPLAAKSFGSPNESGVAGEAPSDGAFAPAPAVSAPAPAHATIEPPSGDETLTRPERQWRWIREASEAGCRDSLAASEADFLPLPDDDTPDANGCGIPRGVILKRGVTGVRYAPALRVDCSFALRLGEVERILAEAAKTHFDAGVARIGHVGTYVCRKVVGRLSGKSGGISEHSFGNAIDVTHVDLDTGRRISVLQHYGSDHAAVKQHRALLHEVLGRVRRETGMRGLGPDFDASHRTHFHFDAGSRWWRW